MRELLFHDFDVAYYGRSLKSWKSRRRKRASKPRFVVCVAFVLFCLCVRFVFASVFVNYLACVVACFPPNVRTYMHATLSQRAGSGGVGARRKARRRRRQTGF